MACAARAPLPALLLLLMSSRREQQLSEGPYDFGELDVPCVRIISVPARGLSAATALSIDVRSLRGFAAFGMTLR